MERFVVEPRTPAWHALRAESWTASAAATLVVGENARLLQKVAADVGVTLDIQPLLDVGLDSFFENTLWRSVAEKQGRVPRFMGNAHTRRGQANEETIVQFFERDRFQVVEREVTARSTEHAGIMASFDALVPASSDPAESAPHGFPLEVKCPAFHSRKKLWDSRKAGEAAYKERTEGDPEPSFFRRRDELATWALRYYWCQVQHQMWVAEAPYAWFIAAGLEPLKADAPAPDPTRLTTMADEDGKVVPAQIMFPIIEKVQRDDEFLAAYQAAALFYHQHFLVEFNEPPLLPQDEAYLLRLADEAALDLAIAESNHEAMVEAYLEIIAEEARLQEKRKMIEGKLMGVAAELRSEMDAGTTVVTVADRLRVTYTTKEGPVSWQKVAKTLVKQAGETAVPAAVLDACRGKPSETVKIQELA